MPLASSIPQAALAATIIASSVGTYIALSPPNPVTKSAPSTGDWVRWANLTHRHTTKATLAPLGLLALHTSTLACLYPTIPSFVLRHGAENGLNRSLITWSPETCIPLALIICAGIPLRLVSYASLGKNFTFALTEPDHLKTTGIYRYVQHPSYTGIFILMLSNILLLGRTDGVLSCWVSPSWYESIGFLRWISTPIAWSLFLGGIWTRVNEEELMLRVKFGAEWERWHSRTARFIPYLL
ncbi:hypothetical protein B0T10DRAFT_401857 [Thelonectria olida]|uniref:Protein-S-isoprenylcysteine O-methyltransferase n=1 Tax=Thelonectria olida TaxID=1576542 RepID=A0A9P9AR86_9HYPO|nr:hypothetical protein B0T10DRAFT_401857 [Thelonectria olida]